MGAGEAGEELLLLDRIAREGARRMLMEALQAEADTITSSAIAASATSTDALVVRNGRA